MKYILVLVLGFFCCFSGRAANVDTVSIYSRSMKKELKAAVIIPASSQYSKKKYPVVYLLHGYSGNYTNWVRIVPQVKDLADQFDLIIVCPDGGYSSWYFDSPLDSTQRFETYISVELPAYIDEHYTTLNNSRGRAITGLSMGGHGGLFLGIRHPDVFGACGSMSGGVDLRPFRKSWEIYRTIGDSSSYPQNWYNYSVVSLVDKKRDSLPAIVFDCGTEDFFYGVNKALHEKMLKQKWPHEYIERPGKHDWAYWGNAVQYQLFFFSNFFKKYQL
jgi:S-formylglutathione hydrolase FrmB